MEHSGGITASLAGRYASALYDLAKERDQVATVEGDLANLDEAIHRSDDLAALIRNPEVSREASARAMDSVAGLLELSPLAKDFLGVLAQNRRLAKLPDVARAFAAIAAAERGEITATVTTAHPLGDAQRRELAAKLKAREGRDVKIDANVDPDILGGLVVTIGSRRIDGSLRTRLNSLAQAMKG
ncbi:MAG TPA: F0F1 ATP synthase subunit delta [Novosphingobium sp.]|nr:F0F1 ATP synthase subunit delta [Novosphingobium sp.]